MNKVDYVAHQITLNGEVKYKVDPTTNANPTHIPNPFNNMGDASSKVSPSYTSGWVKKNSDMFLSKK